MPTRDRPTPPTEPGPIDRDHHRANRPLTGPPSMTAEIPLKSEVYRASRATADPPALLMGLRRALLLVAVAALAIAVGELVYRLGSIGVPPGAR